jgi:hypothetical protein
MVRSALKGRFSTFAEETMAKGGMFLCMTISQVQRRLDVTLVSLHAPE